MVSATYHGHIVPDVVCNMMNWLNSHLATGEGGAIIISGLKKLLIDLSI